MTIPRTTIVVPCYNEAARLDAEAFRGWLADNPWAHVHFVDDGSADQTATVIERIASELPRTTFQVLPQNVGKAEAVRRGMLEVLSNGTVFAGYWDADLATALLEVRRIVDPMLASTTVRLSMGSRVKLLGRSIERHPSRHYLGRVAATLASMVLRLPVYDTQCGAKLFRSSPETITLFEEPFLTRWLFDVELLARIIHQHPDLTRTELEQRVVEVPLLAWRDVEDSRVTLRDVLRTPWSLFRIWRAMRPDKVGKR